MCKHSFKNPVNPLKCNVQEILNLAKEDSNLYFELELDANGVCLFHSGELEWKIKNDFTKKIEKLIDITIKYGISASFQEFQLADSSKVIYIGNKKISKGLSFKNCIFHDNFLVENSTIYKSAFTIEDSFFHQDFRLKNSTIDTINFFNLSVLNFIMDNVNVVYGSAMFNNFICENTFKINECYFENTVDFNYAEFLDDRNGYYGEHINVSFENVKFNGEVDFSNALFNGSVNFKNIDFKIGANFIKTAFSFSRPLTFTNIVIQENGILQFRGVDNQHKIFNSEVRFYDLEVNGVIIFENANFQNILPDHRKQLFSLQKNGKVEIGAGCIKYRHQTSIKRVVVSKQNQNLVSELASTFTQFFQAENGLNLGVEIVEQTEEYIDIFYFSDADISAAEFSERLVISEMDMWRLIKINKQEIVINQYPNKFLDKVLLGTDTIINLIALMLKISARIPIGKISQKELNALMNTTSINQLNQIDSANIEKLNIYQTIILGNKNTQITKF